MMDGCMRADHQVTEQVPKRFVERDRRSKREGKSRPPNETRTLSRSHGCTQRGALDILLPSLSLSYTHTLSHVMVSSDDNHSDHPPPSPTTPGSEEAPLIPRTTPPPCPPVAHPDTLARLTVASDINHNQQHAIRPDISRTASHQSRTLSPIPASPQTSHPSSPRSSYHSTRDRPGSRRSPRTPSPVDGPSRTPCYTPARDHDRQQCADARWIATMTRITSSKTHAVMGFNQVRACGNNPVASG